MASPDHAAKCGLIAIARQAAGLPPLIGARDWNAEYARMLSSDLVKDMGTPGRDNYHGFGQLLDAAIIEHCNALIGA